MWRSGDLYDDLLRLRRLRDESRLNAQPAGVKVEVGVAPRRCLPSIKGGPYPSDDALLSEPCCCVGQLLHERGAAADNCYQSPDEYSRGAYDNCSQYMVKIRARADHLSNTNLSKAVS